jgi:hypothetical protein
MPENITVAEFQRRRETDLPNRHPRAGGDPLTQTLRIIEDMKRL